MERRRADPNSGGKDRGKKARGRKGKKKVLLTTRGGSSLRPLGRPRSMPSPWRPGRHRGAPLLIIYVKDFLPTTLLEARNANASKFSILGRRGGKRLVWQPTSLSTWQWRSRGLEGWTNRVVEYVNRSERGSESPVV